MLKIKQNKFSICIDFQFNSSINLNMLIDFQSFEGHSVTKEIRLL